MNEQMEFPETFSRGCDPYLNCEVAEWFVYGTSLHIKPQPEMCVLLKLNKPEERSDEES